ncbi:sulfatase-like hydrolase/transferase [Neorhodopirellula pilleata]|nr:sulfatase-like hydrolase/transferase [Neorhodopirellula pilleata]
MIACIASPLGMAWADQPSVDSKGKPNVVLFMADDVSWEAFGCYGAEDYQTPNLDRLAERGVRFKHCYSTPLCTPSRVMIMTGKYNFRNYTHFGYLNPEEKTFGQLMKQAGYRTAIAGKWQLNGLSNKKTFPDHDDHDRPHHAGFDEYCLWQLTQERSQGERFWNPTVQINGKLLTKEMNQGKYGPDLFRDFVCDFIQRNRHEPFFVYYPMVLVHDPFLPTPDNIHDSTKTKDGTSDKQKVGTGPAQQKQNFVAMVRYMDKIIGQIVDRLDELGELDNTLVLFTADNGTNRKITSNWNGRTIPGGKGGMKDNGTHVPLIAYWKGMSGAGVECEDLVDFTDFYPTLAEAAGISLDQSDPRDGQSFLPQVLGRPATPRTYALCHYQPYWGSSPEAGAFVRTEQFKLYANGSFYDIANDLDEQHDLSGSISDEMAITIHAHLRRLIKQMPPVPKGDRNSSVRPIHPDWPLIGPRNSMTE